MLTSLEYSSDHNSFLFKTPTFTGPEGHHTPPQPLTPTGRLGSWASAPKAKSGMVISVLLSQLPSSVLPRAMSRHHPKAQSLLDSKPQFTPSFSMNSSQNPPLNLHPPRPEEIPSFLEYQAHARYLLMLVTTLRGIAVHFGHVYPFSSNCILKHRPYAMYRKGGGLGTQEKARAAGLLLSWKVTVW